MAHILTGSQRGGKSNVHQDESTVLTRIDIVWMDVSLNPKKNREERDLKKAAVNRIPLLNPPFPFRVRQFDPWVFDLQNDAPPAELKKN